MRISGVLSVYHADNPSFLNEALKSILRNQTRLLDQCVGVIEGEISLELTAVCDQFKEVKWLQMSQSNSFGLPRALNMAVNSCDGDIIMKIDTDDICAVNRVESTIAAFEKNPSLTIHGGQIQEFSNDFKRSFGIRSVPTRNLEIRNFSKFRNPFNGPTVAFKKEAFTCCGGFPQVGANEDYCLWSLFLVNGLDASNSSTIYAYMRGGEGLVVRRSSAATRKGEYEALKYLKEIDHLNYAQFIVHVLGKQVVRRLPVKWNSYIYSKLRRNRDQSIPQNLLSILQKIQNEN